MLEMNNIESMQVGFNLRRKGNIKIGKYQEFEFLLYKFSLLLGKLVPYYSILK